LDRHAVHLGEGHPPAGEIAAEFAREVIELGRSDARAWLERDWGPDGPWVTDPIEVLEERGL
jgi:hypothetical protein